ncbi:probable myosin-binding protein 4 isoform X1 [Pyrus x bretschneideri]|uniref:probable myosin-binding protein 4 isoform X1 n=1 Tax=Pyrus x bretschneideri TaxID=225117 RepID=UPI00202FB1CD|nr:probable myosin-binding protein 4 isoform X1 [Pyrus x bretschneideri]
MAVKGNPSVHVQKNLEGFVTILTSAACEWVLIFLLLVDGLLSYLLTKFADYCNLQKPCIFCSRFEHVIGSEKPQLYQDLLCSNHISEFSSWLSSQIYGKHDHSGMCEDCLKSYTKKGKSNPEKHMLSGGKSDSDIGSSSSRRSMQNRKFVHGSVGVRTCSCCSRPCRPRENARGQQRKSSASKPNIPLPRFSSRSRIPRRDGSKRTRDKTSGSVTTHRPGKPGWDPLPHRGHRELRISSDTDSTLRPGNFSWDPLPHVGYTKLRISSDTDSTRRAGKLGWDPLSHVGYTELKISSDTDSEIPFSDEDGGRSIIIGNEEHKKEALVVQYASEKPFKAQPNGLNPAKQSNITTDHKPSLSDPSVQPDDSKRSDVKFLGLNVASENGLDELNWQQPSQNSIPYAFPELISLDDIPPSFNVVEKTGFAGTSDFGDASISKNDELLKSISATDGAPIKTDLIINDPDLTKPNHINGNAVSESAGIGKEGDSIKEQPPVKVLDRVDGEVKPANSQSSSAQERNLSSNNTITGVHGVGDEKPVADASDSSAQESNLSSHKTSSAVLGAGAKTLVTDASKSSVQESNLSSNNTISVVCGVGDEKPVPDASNSSAHNSNLSSNNTISGVRGGGDEKQVTDASNSNPNPGLKTSWSVESLDGGYVSEIEGESIVDLLKRQVDYYRKSLKELFKELDEERNAAEIAANQAMAMITKLQEEKAAIHMEALQYLRMMEEQAEFDVDALEKANDLLAEKEKHIQDLEAELEFSNFEIPDESTMESMPMLELPAFPVLQGKSCNLKGEIDTVESTVVPSVKSDVKVTGNSTVTEVPKASNERLFSETTLLEFEDEKLYISNCLKSLERKLSEISCNGASTSMPNGGHSRKQTNDGPDQVETPRKFRLLLNGQIEEEVVQTPNDLHISNGSAAPQEGPIHSDSLDCEEEKDSDLVVLENEISDLNDRLEALETDHDFLEHMLYSLQNGQEGLQFIQEIAQQLRELRKIGAAFRNQSVP